MLNGLRVVELAHMVSAPACGQLLATLGAEVIKVEPRQGDITRRLGPSLEPDLTTLFCSVNRGKRSVCLDVADPGDSSRVFDLARLADVMISNLDRQVLQRAGLDYAQLSAVNPGIVYALITGLGVAGQPATDGLVQAAMGMMAMTGPDEAGFRTGPPVVDISCGTWAALAILAALQQRPTRGGRGDLLTIALDAVGLNLQATHLEMWKADPAQVRRVGNDSVMACAPVFSALDGRVAAVILHDRHWASFCAAIGRRDLFADERFNTNVRRRDHQRELIALLDPTFSERTRAEWVTLLRDHRVPCAPERTYEEVTGDAGLRERGLLTTLPQGDTRSLAVGLPVQFASWRPTNATAPRLGEDGAHLDEVLARWRSHAR